jgi:pyruvate dehydrogenase E2 component (dihydrolipoamide acetyltransferase)
MADVIMPKMGDAMEEGVIVQWLKKVGDAVKPDDAIAEIETDKSNVEVPAEAAGFIQALKFQAGDSVPVGQVIAVIGAEAVAAGAAPAEPAPAPAAAATPPAPVASTPAPVASNGNGTAPPTPAPVAAPPSSAPVTASGPVTVSAPTDFRPYNSFVGAMPENLGGSASIIGEPVIVGGGEAAAGGGERVKATPVARAMAEAHNLDLAALRGSGPDGAVAKRDVEAALANGATPAAPVAAPATTSAPATSAAAPALSDDVEVQEYNAMRRTIAKRLTESKQNTPHFYVTVEIDMENLFTFREQVNATAVEGQPKVSLNDFLVKAVAVALTENPVVNSSFADNKRYMKKAVNIGVAVSIEDGLIVPVVRDCHIKSVRAIAKETRPLIEKAREGKLAPSDYQGGTFTISNLGSVSPNVENFAAIINPGEGGILAVSSIRQVPAVVDGGQIVARRRMKVTLCADHRVMDGVSGALFCESLKRIIENPIQIIA